MEDIKTAIKIFCELHNIKCTRIDLKKLEIAEVKNRFSTICYYTVRKGIRLCIDYDFIRGMDNEIILM